LFLGFLVYYAFLLNSKLKKRGFFARSRLSRKRAEAWQRHVAQVIGKPDAEIAQEWRSC
jgi:hypothetical protein